jgi:hypothetical protein
MQLLKAEPIYTMAQGHGSILGSVYLRASYNHCTNDTLASKMYSLESNTSKEFKI